MTTPIMRERDRATGAIQPLPGRRDGQNVLHISNFVDDVCGDHREVSAEVDGDRVFFRSPKHFEIYCRAEPFVGIALFAAMARGADIEVEDSNPISEKLLRALPEIQNIYACWNSDLRPIHVHVRVRAYTDNYVSHKVGSFYSAGVDGSFTLRRNLTDITHLIMLGGVEWAGNTPESWRSAVQRNTAFARSIGKELVPIDTNVKEWADKRRIHWTLIHGPILSSMGPLLGVKRLYVASSHTYNELFPWGSHPLTDPMWSTEGTTVIHDGAAFRRGEKMKKICEHDRILNNLKACWHSIHENCGQCPKCIRTMTALSLLGASSKAFPKFDYKPGMLKSFRSRDESGASFLEDALILATEAKNRKMHRVLRRYYRMYKMRQAGKMIDKYLLGGILRRTYRLCASSRRSAPRKWLIEVRGAEDWDV